MNDSGTAMSLAAFSELKKKVTTFVRQELIPLERLPYYLDWEKMLPMLDDRRDDVKALGLWLPQIPQSYGGLGLSLREFGEISAILGESLYGHYCFNCQAPDAGNMEILIEYGTPEQKEKYLKPLLEGRIRSCFSMTEPNQAGSNPLLMDTTARPEGEEYVIHGKKWFTSSAEGSAFAIVMAITHPDAPNPYERASQLIVETDNPGFRHLRKIPVGGETGFGWASHSEISYEQCRVPATNLLGNAGKGFAIAQNRLGPGRIHHCMRWLGICERAFGMMVARASNRNLGNGKKLADQQTVQNWIAECKADMYAARLMVLDTARKIDIEGAYAARLEVSMIKFHCARVLQKVLDCAIQVYGAEGISDDTPLAYWYRHERGARIYDGADEVHKARVAKMIFKAAHQKSMEL